jgi:hypothetical protein
MTVALAIQMLEAAYNAYKLLQAIEATGRTTLAPHEVAAINTALQTMRPEFTGVDFLKAAEPGGSG